MNTIKDILIECQSGNHCHASLIKKLQKLYNKSVKETFEDEFIRLLKKILVVGQRDPIVERSIDFVAKFVTSLKIDECQNKENMNVSQCDQELHPFLLKMFHFLIKIHKANDKGARFRCCQLMHKFLVEMGDEADIDNELFSRIYDSMLSRLQDKVPLVRTYAALALSRLQDPKDVNCPITEAYLFVMKSDPISDVRRSVLYSIAVSARSLPSVIQRTRDINVSVRTLAYKILADKVFIRALTISQRIKLLETGLKDSSEKVKNECIKKLLPAWLRTYNGNMIELLSALDIESSAKICEIMLISLFDQTNASELVSVYDLLNENRCIPVDMLTCENSFYWRCLCSYYKSKDMEENVDKILPSCVNYVQYIEGVVANLKSENMIDTLKNSFILNEVLKLLLILDLSDEVGRRSINTLIQNLLISDKTPSTVVPFLTSQFCLLRTNVDTLCMSIAEIISEIRQPIETAPAAVTLIDSSEQEPSVTSVAAQQASMHMSAEDKRKMDIKLAAIYVQLDELKDLLTEHVSNQKFLEAAEIKQKILQLEITKKEVLSESNNITTGCSTTGSNSGTSISSGEKLAAHEKPASDVLNQEREDITENFKIEKNDAFTLLKCLSIVCQMLQDLRIKSLNPPLLSIMDSLIIPCIQNSDPAIRNVAVKALGLSCLRDLNKAIDFLVLFLQVAKMDTEVVRVTALKVITDILTFYNNNEFSLNWEEGDDEIESASEMEPLDEPELQKNDIVSKVVVCLSSLLNNENKDIQTQSVISFCKFLLYGRINSASLLSRLIIMWYNPMTEDDTDLRNCLATFFPMFAFENRSNLDMMSEAVLPALRTVFNAPTTSPLCQIKVANMAELLVHLTNIRHLHKKEERENEDDRPHDAMAIKIANEILSNYDDIENIKVYLKLLTLLELSPKNESSLADLQKLNQQMLEKIDDRNCLKMIAKFDKQVKDLLVKINNSYLITSSISTTGEDMVISESSSTTSILNNTNASRLITGTSATKKKSGVLLKKRIKLMKMHSELEIEDSDYSSPSNNETKSNEIINTPQRVSIARSAKNVAQNKIKELSESKRQSSQMNKSQESEGDITIIPDSQ